jgi:transitional endoplasmic reticulum ATPase
MDEIDSIAPQRGGGEDSKVTERVISQLLTEMDGLESLHDVVVIAATNRPDIMDPALMRPGRFDRSLFVGPPDVDARKAILGIHTKNKHLADDVDLDEIARKTEDYTGADLAALCNEAVMTSVREIVASGVVPSEEEMKEKKVKMADFLKALEKIKPLSKQELGKFEDLADKLRYMR